jgi:micrococcal nuclease
MTNSGRLTLYLKTKFLKFSALAALAAFLTLATGPAFAIDKCGSGPRETCVVDGDTIWLQGEKIRMQGYDTPEPTTGICGGDMERQLAQQASNRLIALLNGGDVTIQRFGLDRYDRTLATIRVDGVDVGETLIAEGLARSWPDGPEFWCK